MKRILVAYILITVVAVSLLFSFSNYSLGTTKGKTPFHSQIFKVGSGYGYQIDLKGRILIKQEYIPILEGKRPFTTAKDAQRTANKVISKLLKKESPVLTISELEELKPY
ncbi:MULTISPECIES: DUF4907 domain-containing protein [unclassified Arenibacter]|uniref:DUF4907 domain-containing protein n=1 Tax=unclassified Arenibacter TaxID=2615047 RepID=UPI0015F2A625|nr:MULTISPECIES: DUF4907 domain-containing protein [unclassified Arenibacter]